MKSLNIRYSLLTTILVISICAAIAFKIYLTREIVRIDVEQLIALETQRQISMGLETSPERAAEGLALRVLKVVKRDYRYCKINFGSEQENGRNITELVYKKTLQMAAND